MTHEASNSNIPLTVSEFFLRAQERLTLDAPAELTDLNFIPRHDDLDTDPAVAAAIAAVRPIRPAAVLVPIVERNEPSVLLTQRTTHLNDHGYMSSLGLPLPSLFTLIAIIVEIGGGLLMLVGYQTRLVALGLAIFVLVAAFIGHFQLTDLNQFQHFMKNIAIVGGSLAFVAFGAGAYSLDAQKSETLKQIRTP